PHGDVQRSGMWSKSVVAVVGMTVVCRYDGVNVAVRIRGYSRELVRDWTDLYCPNRLSGGRYFVDYPVEPRTTAEQNVACSIHRCVVVQLSLGVKHSLPLAFSFGIEFGQPHVAAKRKHREV